MIPLQLIKHNHISDINLDSPKVDSWGSVDTSPSHGSYDSGSSWGSSSYDSGSSSGFDSGSCDCGGGCD